MRGGGLEAIDQAPASGPSNISWSWRKGQEQREEKEEEEEEEEEEGRWSEKRRL